MEVDEDADEDADVYADELEYEDYDADRLRIRM